jgi:UDP-N-acetylmuramate dehydrogenase
VAAEARSPDAGRLFDQLRVALGTDAVQANEPLARYTALRIGGPADLFASVDSVQTLQRAVELARECRVPCQVLGGGSNVLVSDAGVRGLVVLNRARAVTFGELQARAESGASFSTVARRCVARGLAGLEWAASIPGTVGGAVVGNAGAWGGDVASTLVRATILESGGAVVEWPVERFDYGYRTSVLKRQSLEGTPRAIVLAAEFALRAGDRGTLEGQVTGMAARRKASQPPGATCGSVFKNPPGDYAGRLVEAAGLKGKRREGAEISSAHANFVVNHGQATAVDVKALIDEARLAVQARFGISLELEIELMGAW